MFVLNTLNLFLLQNSKYNAHGIHSVSYQYLPKPMKDTRRKFTIQQATNSEAIASVCH